LGLPPGAIVADVGAGSGNYSRALAERGYRVKAVEPSVVMREQAAPHPGVESVEGMAEEIPLADGAANGLINVLSFHHYIDPTRALREMARVVRGGPILLFTFDHRASERFWLADYFPGIWSAALTAFPPLGELAALVAGATGREVISEVFALPHDLQDLFMAAAWRRPHLYLDLVVRANISAFGVADPDEVQSGVTRLAEDLETGEWRLRYGEVLEREALDLGYCFLVARPPAP
jgi:SAM-dependent methyltransferase